MEKEPLKMEIRNVNERFKCGGFGEDFNEAKCISLGLFLFLSRFYKKALYPNFLISLHRKCKVEDCRIECRC
jgi:hypothetical protein